MTPEQRTLLAEEYIRSIETGWKESFDAAEAITFLAFAQDWEELWAVSLELVRLVPDDDEETQSVIAAGPIEDMVRYAGPLLVERFVAEIERSPKFARILSGTWARGEQPEFWATVLPLLKR